MKPRKLLARIAQSQTNVAFADLVRLAKALGFQLDRMVGGHHIFIHGVHGEAMLNLQSDRGQAKPYQVKQLLRLVEEYDLRLDEGT